MSALRPYQVCERCWRMRRGSGKATRTEFPPRLAGNVRENTLCAVCGDLTDSGYYPLLADDEVRTKVTILFQDGPRRGETGLSALMSVRTYDTVDEAGVPIRYNCELIGGVLVAHVSPVQREDAAHAPDLGIIRS